MNYYRHFKHANLKCQLNHFGFVLVPPQPADQGRGQPLLTRTRRQAGLSPPLVKISKTPVRFPAAPITTRTKAVCTISTQIKPLFASVLAVSRLARSSPQARPVIVNNDVASWDCCLNHLGELHGTRLDARNGANAESRPRSLFAFEMRRANTPSLGALVGGPGTRCLRCAVARCGKGGVA